jgi:2-polyprenyl-3-methyl-5-hydroxy-6-metoxy-1,4-benzoquinol methylase
MKLLDRLIRTWRTNVALKYIPENANNVYDIGCDDGYLLRRLSYLSGQLDGIDPGEIVVKDFPVTKGFFPGAVDEDKQQQSYDAIFALAVFEHFTESDIKESARVISKMLSPNGRLILTVPHPFVDEILDVLLWLRLIDGQALDEHHGFEPDDLEVYFSDTLKLVRKDTFQFGLNNIFIFERK